MCCDTKSDGVTGYPPPSPLDKGRHPSFWHLSKCYGNVPAQIKCFQPVRSTRRVPQVSTPWSLKWQRRAANVFSRRFPWNLKRSQSAANISRVQFPWNLANRQLQSFPVCSFLETCNSNTALQTFPACLQFPEKSVGSQRLVSLCVSHETKHHHTNTLWCQKISQLCARCRIK